MEDPVKEIPEVIRLLIQTSPSQQREAIETYFTPDAAFTHPFVRTPAFPGSRHLLHIIYRWYKIMSPRVDFTIHSIAYDAPALLLYVNMSQVFRIWLLPWYRAPVTLVAVLQLVRDAPSGRYYVRSQNDLYQVDQWVRFIPGLFGGAVVVWVCQFLATFVCLVGAAVLWPVTWVEEYVKPQGWIGVAGR